jgi:very-short-patch-repair endonuclease
VGETYSKEKENIEIDKEVNPELQKQGWSVLRFRDNEINKNVLTCAEKTEQETAVRKNEIQRKNIA